jgi:hypothetical protein
MIILSFIIGSSLGLVGTIGADMMSLVTYIMSIDNFHANPPLLLNKIKGDAIQYIERCIHGDGNIAAAIGLTDYLSSFDEINGAELDIADAMSQFQTIQGQCSTYEELSQKLINEASVDGSTQLKPFRGEDDENRKLIKYSEILDKINNLEEGMIRWKVQASNDLTCADASSTEITYLKPSNCQPYSQKEDKSALFGKYADILKNIDDMVTEANKDDVTDSVRSVIDTLKGQYDSFLGKYTDELVRFQNIIHQITGLVRQYSGDNDLFSFLNGKFIATNLKIILKYLKYSLGVDLYTVGVCLIVVGFSLALSVCSTIILIIIINIELKKNMDAKRLANTENVPDIQPNFPQQAITYDKNY